MAVSQRLDLRQTQSLVMTPQLQQAIKLLQLSNVELAAYIEQELERNPLLERDEAGQESAAGTQVDGDEHQARRETGDEPDSATLTNSEQMQGGEDAPLDTDYDNVYDDNLATEGLGGASAFSQSGSGGQWDGDESSIEQRAAEPKTLRQHLLDQVSMDLRDPAERLIGAYLIEMLDESGYLRGDLDQVAEALGCPRALVDQTLTKVQRLERTGIRARSLSECLALR